MDVRLQGRKPPTAADITSDPSHKPFWWRSMGVAYDWAAELAKSTAADQVMVDWGKAIMEDRNGQP